MISMTHSLPYIDFGAGRLTIEQVVALARRRALPRLSQDPAFAEQIGRGAAFLERLLAEEGAIYGVTTGYGDSVTRAIPSHLVAELPLHLTRFHGCGLGAELSMEAGRAVLATRLCSLTQGYRESVSSCWSGSAGCWRRIWCRGSPRRDRWGPAGI